MFEINDKVVCISEFNKLNAYAPPSSWPRVGDVYVIRGVNLDAAGELRLYLVGIFAAIHPSGVEQAFWYERFRKLTDIQAENRAKAKQKKGKIHELAQ